MNSIYKFFDLVLKIIFSIFFAVTSVYCLLAFLPYTYHAVIKSPTYVWIPWFAQHNPALYWTAFVSAAVAYRSQVRSLGYSLCFCILACIGIVNTIQPLLPNITNDFVAYLAALSALWIVIVVILVGNLGDGKLQEHEFHKVSTHLSIKTAILLGFFIALITATNSQFRGDLNSDNFQFQSNRIYLDIWSIICHVLVAIVLVSMINLVLVASSKSTSPRNTKYGGFGLLIFIPLLVLSARFLENTLSFSGLLSYLYATSLTLMITLTCLSLIVAWSLNICSVALNSIRIRRAGLIIALIFLTLVLIELPDLIGDEDWNGFLHGTLTLMIWLALSFCLFCFSWSKTRYSARAIMLILVLSILSYQTLSATGRFWSKALGSSSDEISKSLESYASRDASFNFAYRLLGNGGVSRPCDEVCALMRAYTEIDQAKVPFEVHLVDPLLPARGNRPNIFFFVIDSMRPDYLGAYNGKVTFTPNLDRFARDSVIFHNVFTQYAGTSLSEPAIWAGALLLHAHYMTPFGRVNGLEKLIKSDDYEMFVSNDDVLQEILSPSNNLIKLDTDKKLWAQLDICSTVKQAELAIDQHADPARPIFFYTQPKNVHLLARNKLPKSIDVGWPAHPGFSDRISLALNQTDNCFGEFIDWLKVRNLYDESILIVTSDHGDATGELGRSGHSLIIYPEVMRVPLIVHLPKSVQNKYAHDDERISSLIDITPSLYYLLGHRPILRNSIFGRPLFAETAAELDLYKRDELFMASDIRPAYGILADNGRYFYATYDSPAQRDLYDLVVDPKGEHNLILTDALKHHFDELVVTNLRRIGDFYQYKPPSGVREATSGK